MRRPKWGHPSRGADRFQQGYRHTARTLETRQLLDNSPAPGDPCLRRGPAGGPTKLTDAQQQQVARLIVGNNPDQLKLPGFLWTRALVRELIAQRFGIESQPAAELRILATTKS
jgi:hypothetical protein